MDRRRPLLRFRRAACEEMLNARMALCRRRPRKGLPSVPYPALGNLRNIAVAPSPGRGGACLRRMLPMLGLDSRASPQDAQVTIVIETFVRHRGEIRQSRDLGLCSALANGCEVTIEVMFVGSERPKHLLRGFDGIVGPGI